MTLGEATIGSLVYLRVNGDYTAFRVMHHGKPDSTYDSSYEGGTILMMDYATAPYVIAMVAQEDGVKGDYSGSYIHSWLNNTFMGYLDETIAQEVVQVKLPYRKGIEDDPYEVATGSRGLAAKAWVPSMAEVARVALYVSGYDSFYVTEGAKFDYWKGMTVDGYRDWRNHDMAADRDLGWSTRTPNIYSNGNYLEYFFKISVVGEAYNAISNEAYVRPCLVLPSDLTLDGDNYVKVGPEVPVKVNGAWKSGVSWAKQGGVWRETASVHAKVGGTWKG